MGQSAKGIRRGALCAALSSPFPSSITRSAASQFLSMAGGLELDDVFHFLVWQRTLPTALAHLADAGADLERLTVSPSHLRATFPSGYRPIWDLDTSRPLPAARILDIYAEHRRLLAEPVEVLSGAGFDRCTLLSGRAYQARYPDYATRVEFDTDLMALDVESAMGATALLETAGYALDTLRVRCLGPSPDATVEIRRRIRGHLVSVGILVGGYHAHRARSHNGSEIVDFRGRSVRVPTPEDLLVMLAARVERKRSFALVNVNDAAVVLANDGDRLDWDHIVGAVRLSHLEPTLAVILHHAEQLLGRPVVPKRVMAALVDAGRILYRMALRVAASDMWWGEPSTEDRAVQRIWRIDLARRHLMRDESPSLRIEAARRLQRALLKRQVRLVSAQGKLRPLGRAATRARTRVGAFCEVAPHLSGTAQCVGQLGPWRGSPRARALLRACVEDINRPVGPHRCSRLIFDLSERHASQAREPRRREP